ncbi:MAG: CinA family nicotinamide mononucleotide deamidase-related protein [Candidatus Ozemobacteraceae bacterium]
MTKKRLRAEILSIGTELLLGEILDTNAPFLARELKDRGVDIYHKQTVGDNRGRLTEALRLATSRSDLVITTGGLGPTAGDLTREAIADLAGQTPVIDEGLLANLSAMFAHRNRPMPEINRKQAWLIPAANTLPNAIGTAPGWLVTLGHARIVALPGPPHEMRRMWHEQALPRLSLPQAALSATTLHTLGIGEGSLVEHLADLVFSPNPTVATYARPHGVDIRVAAAASTKEEADAIANPVIDQIAALVGTACYGRDEETLAGVVTDSLRRLDATVSIGERFTGGRLCELLLEAVDVAPEVAGNDTSGTLTRFREGRVQGFSPDVAIRRNWTMEDAEALRKETKVDWLLLVGAEHPFVSGENGDSSPETKAPKAHVQREAHHAETQKEAQKEVQTKAQTKVQKRDGFGSVQIALLTPDGRFLEEYLNWPGERKHLRERAAHAALMMLYKELIAPVRS